MKIRVLFCILCLSMLLANQKSYSNTTELDSIIRISGQIIHADSLHPIPFATLSIKRTKKGIICDSLGIFHLQVQQYDTLSISALGYQKIEWEIPLIINPNFPPFFQIKLEDISYILDEVEIYALGTWEDFKEEFIHSKLPEKIQVKADLSISKKEMQIIRDIIVAKAEPDFLGGLIYYASMLFPNKKKPLPIFSEEIKELHEQILNEKFNKKIIEELTHEKDKQLEKLMIFINLKTNFTYQDTEAYIQAKITELYKEFKQKSDTANTNMLAIDTIKRIPNHLKPF